MISFKKPLLFLILVIGGLVVGFIYLLRGCLSKYDERSAQSPIVYVTNEKGSVVFSIVKFEKTQSYSQKGGFVSKSVSTSYFVQTNDAVTGAKLAEKKIKHHSDIRHYPVEVMGEANGQAWIFMGEPMAFDAFTLKEVANFEILEKKNSQLKGKLPMERRFYVFDPDEGEIIITANDGSLWKLDCKSLMAVLTEDDGKIDRKSTGVKRLENEIKKNQVLIDNLMKEKIEKPLHLLTDRKITPAQHRKMMEGFNEQRRILYEIRDSLRTQLFVAEKSERNNREIERKIQSLRNSRNLRFGDVKSNMDTTADAWYGLYSLQEMESLHERIQFHSPHGDAARRRLFSSTIVLKNDEPYFDREKITETNSDYFLNGGFLVSKSTGMPLQLSPLSYLIIHKSKIGIEGTILVSRVNAEGKTHWTIDTQLKEWTDYSCDNNRLIVLGTNNEELSGSDCNLLLSIELSSGKFVRYDFFTDKILD